MINEILNKTTFNVILRPHPYNRYDQRIFEIGKLFKKNSKFNYDESDNYIHTYSKSMILITDLSGTAYTYTFLTLNPVIFFSPYEEKIKSYNYDKLKYFINREKIGVIIN